jgi:hypothetical protein
MLCRSFLRWCYSCQRRFRIRLVPTHSSNSYPSAVQICNTATKIIGITLTTRRITTDYCLHLSNENFCQSRIKRLLKITIQHITKSINAVFGLVILFCVVRSLFCMCNKTRFGNLIIFVDKNARSTQNNFF